MNNEIAGAAHAGKRRARNEGKETDHELVMEFLPVIRRMASLLMRRLPAHMRMDDLEAAGIVGLLQATQLRDPNRSEQFGAYARLRIEGAMLDEVRKQDVLPKDARTVSNRIVTAMSAVQARCGKIDEEMVAHELGVPLTEYRAMLERTVDVRLVSMESSEVSRKVYDQLPGNQPTALDSLLAAESCARVAAALSRLPDKQRKILAFHYIEELNMKEIAMVLDISQARVTQLHSEAVHSVRAILGQEEGDLTMSSSGMYPALSGAVAESQNLDVLANNLANASSASFRAQRMGFQEVLSRAQVAPGRAEQRFVQPTSTRSDLSQGVMQHTGQATDLALSGPGFLAVLGATGERYVRGGSLVRRGDGHLVTSTGQAVLDRSGAPIVVPPTEPPSILSIGTSGEILADDKVVSQLKLVEFQNPQALRTEGGGLYAAPGGKQGPAPATQTQVLPETLEGANVSPVRTMTDVINTSRHYEALHRVIEAFKEIDTTAARDLPTIS